MQDILLTVFTGILAIAVLIQSLMFFGMYKSIRRIKTWMEGSGKNLIQETSAISSKLNEALAAIRDVADGLQPVREKLVDTTDIVHRRVTDLDAFLSEVTQAGRLQILRIQDTIQCAAERMQETLELLHNSVAAPLNEIQAISRAIRVGLNLLFRGRKSVSNGSIQDEEMFI